MRDALGAVRDLARRCIVDVLFHDGQELLIPYAQLLSMPTTLKVKVEQPS